MFVIDTVEKTINTKPIRINLMLLPSILATELTCISRAIDTRSYIGVIPYGDWIYKLVSVSTDKIYRMCDIKLVSKYDYIENVNNGYNIEKVCWYIDDNTINIDDMFNCERS